MLLSVIPFSRSAAVLLLSAATLCGCSATGPITSDNVVPAAASSAQPLVPAPQGGSTQSTKQSTHKKPSHKTSSHNASSPSHKSSSNQSKSGPRVVYLRVAQKPKCEEGTAVFRAKAVPLIIEWKITGATGGALSVDDPTNTPGTYGPVALKGSEEFLFTCAGPVGSVETHTYAIYTAGGGKVHSRTVKASAKVLDKGLGTN